jgi:hypothetical protein
MPDHEFTLLIEGPDLQSDANLNALFDGGCDDALFGRRDSVQYADFTREATSFSEAISSAIEDIESAVSGTRVLRVEPEEFVTLTAIAGRMNRSREGIRLLAEGKRGPGGFPAPVSWIDAKTRIWRWPDVAAWFNSELGEPVEAVAEAETIAAFNGLLGASLHLNRIRVSGEREVFASFVEREMSGLRSVT